MYVRTQDDDDVDGVAQNGGHSPVIEKQTYSLGLYTRCDAAKNSLVRCSHSQLVNKDHLSVLSMK